MTRDRLADLLEGLLYDGMVACRDALDVGKGHIDRHRWMQLVLGCVVVILFVPIGVIARLVRR